MDAEWRFSASQGFVPVGQGRAVEATRHLDGRPSWATRPINYRTPDGLTVLKYADKQHGNRAKKARQERKNRGKR